MKSIKEKALYNTAKIIKQMDNNVLAMEYIDKESVILHRQARLKLYTILENNGYSLSNTYKPIKIIKDERI